MEDEEGIIYGRGKEPGGQNNSSRRNNRRTRTADGHRDAQRVTPTLARLTADRPKVGKRSEKTSKISQCRTKLQFPDLTQTRLTSFVRSFVRRMKKRKLVSLSTTVGQHRDKEQEIDRKLQVFIRDLSHPRTKCVQRVSRASRRFFDDSYGIWKTRSRFSYPFARESGRTLKDRPCDSAAAKSDT